MIIRLTEEQRDEVLYILTHLYQGYQPIVKAEIITQCIDALQKDCKEDLIKKIEMKENFMMLGHSGDYWTGLSSGMSYAIDVVKEY